MNILVCDDDREIARAVGIYLKNEGYGVFSAYDGMEAMEIIRSEAIHLAVIDIMMPRMDGITLVEKIRETRNIPIILLSAKSEDVDKIQGLSAGADDYVTKPFNPMELIARVRSQLRRYVDLGCMEKRAGVYRTGGLVVDEETRTVTVDGDPVALTKTEYEILLLLTRNAGRVFTMDQIYESVWDEPAISPQNTIAVHVRRIREKIEIDPADPRYLKVVWGIGYKVDKIDASGRAGKEG